MSDENPTPESPVEHPTPNEGDAPVAVDPTTIRTVAPTGRLQAFRDIRRELTEAELTSPGVQKLILNQLVTAQSDCEILQGYVQRYHEADKRAAVLEVKLKTDNSVEILFGVGLGAGFAIIGLAPYFWDQSARGSIALAVGIFLVFGSTIARLAKR